MNIENIMTKEILSCNINTPIWEVSRMMAEYDIGFIPICKDTKIIGVITDRDICIRCCKENVNLSNSIENYITKNINTINLNDNIDNALSVLAKNKIKRLIVKDDNNFIGILSLSDIINHSKEINNLLKTLQSIWSIDKTNNDSDVSVDSYEL